MDIFGTSARSLRTALGSVLFASLVFGFLCVSFVHSIPDAHARMDSMGGQHASQHAASCCDANAADHMELWKSTFVGIPQSFHDLLVLCAVVFVAFAFAGFSKLLTQNDAVLAFRFRQYARKHPIQLFDPLRLAFAQGILHPKTF